MASRHCIEVRPGPLPWSEANCSDRTRVAIGGLIEDDKVHIEFLRVKFDPIEWLALKRF
jgi:hypothetical protein